MSIGAELGQYILQTHNKKNLKSNGGLNSPPPNPFLGMLVTATVILCLL